MPENTKLRAELEALPQDALELRCRRSGVSRKGGGADQVRGCCCALIKARSQRWASTIKSAELLLELEQRRLQDRLVEKFVRSKGVGRVAIVAEFVRAFR